MAEAAVVTAETTKTCKAKLQQSSHHHRGASIHTNTRSVKQMQTSS